VSGKVYAQPLYVEQAAVRCGTPRGSVHNANIVYVATLENIVYAIDVDAAGGPAECWHTPQLGTPEPAAGLLGFDPHNEGGIRVASSARR